MSPLGSSKLIKATSLTLLGAGTLAGLAACSSETADVASSSAATSTSEAATESSSSSSTTSYTAGTYSESGSYQSPAGEESVKVSVDLDSDGTIASVTVTPEATNPQSQQYQKKFASAISGEVVGKKISELNVSKVSGSSLTSTGFNAAIDSIIDEAKA